MAVARTLVDFSQTGSRRRLTHPTQYSDLRLRLLASRGLYQDAALMTAAAVDQDPVGAWLDHNRPYLAFTQATVGNKPKLLLGATPAGGNAVRFTTSLSTTLAVTLSATAGVRAMDFRVQEHTIVAAFRVWEAPAGLSILFAPSGSGNFYAAYTTGAAIFHSFTDASPTNRTTSVASAYTVGAWCVAAWRLSKLTGDYATGDMSVNLRSSQSINSSTTKSAAGSTLNITSTAWRLGALSAGSNHASVDLAELDVYGGALSDDDVAALVGDLVIEHGL